MRFKTIFWRKCAAISLSAAATFFTAHAAFAEPAVFFDADLDAGRQNFVNVVNSTVSSGSTPELFTLNLSSATASGGVYSVIGDNGSTVYVKLSVGGSSLDQNNFNNSGGIYNTSVSLSNTGLANWNEAVDEGFKVGFYSDSAATTAVSMNALGLEVSDWGTCCTTGNYDSDGNPVPGTAVYAVFDPESDPTGSDSKINLIGNIESSGDRGTFAGTLADGSSPNLTNGYDNHFVAAINDTNLFNVASIVPNGSGEAFGYGGILYFSQVAIGSVPEGSSEVNVGSKRDITESDDVQSELGSDLNYVFDGGTLSTTANSPEDFEVKSGGGAIDTQGNVLTFSGDFTGVGAFTKTGAGTLVMTGQNTYSGGTTVASGVLDTTGGGTLDDQGSVGVLAGGAYIVGTADRIGALTNSGTLTVGAALRASSVTNDGNAIINGALTSDSSILNAATGSLDMGADVSVAGLTVNDGAIDMIGAQLLTTSGLTGAGSISIGAGDALEVSQSGNTLYAGSINGSGGFTKSGAGTLVLTHNGSRAGALSVRSGTLVLNGSITTTLAQVNAGSILKGTGTAIGDLRVSGTLAPGNSPGTMTVNGDVTFLPGSTFQAEVDGRNYDPAGGAGTYDRLVVTGATSVVSLNGTIRPVLRGMTGANNNFVPRIGDVFRVIEATDNASAISGEFAKSVLRPNGIKAGTRFSVIYGEDYVDLAIVPDDFGAFMKSYDYENAENAGRAIEKIYTNRVSAEAEEFANGFAGLTPSQIARTVLEASGEVHAFALDGLRASNRQMSSSAMAHIMENPEGKRFWGDMGGFVSEYDEDRISPGFDADYHHLVLGLDLINGPKSRTGVAFGYSGGSTSSDASGSSDYSTVGMSVYYNYENAGFRVGTSAGYAFGDLETNRSVTQSNGLRFNESEGNANIAYFDIRAEKAYDLSRAVQGTLWTNLRAEAVYGDAYVETGSGVTALAAASETYTAGQVSLGYDLSGKLKMGSASGDWTLGIGATYSGGPDRIIERDLALHGQSWSVSTPHISRVSGFVSAGLEMQIEEHTTLSVALQTAHASDWQAHGASVNFSTSW